MTLSYHELRAKASKLEKKALDLLSEQVRFPSVSGRDDKSLGECADTVCRQLQGLGFKTRQFTKGGPPVVYAERNVGAKKTLMFYHHYDVQTEGDLELWDSPPAKLSVRKGRAYGRGTIDDKGPLVGSLAGVILAEEALGELPVNVKFVIEGQEEFSSAELIKWASKQGSKYLKADGCGWEMLSATEGSTTEVIAGMKGCVGIELSVGGNPTYPNVDAHSGMAGVIPSATWKLVWALNSLKDSDDKILIEGFDKIAKRPSKEDLAVLRDYKGDIGKHLRESYGMDKLHKNKKGVDLLSALYLEPTLSIHGITSGVHGSDDSTIVPAKATAKLDLRLVPDLTVEKVEKLLRAHLNKKGFGDVKVWAEGYDPAKTPVSNPFVELVHRAASQVARPAHANLLPSMYGTGPAYLFIPYTPVCISISYAEVDSTNEHGVNENIPVKALLANAAFVATVAQNMAVHRT